MNRLYESNLSLTDFCETTKCLRHAICWDNDDGAGWEGVGEEGRGCEEGSEAIY